MKATRCQCGAVTVETESGESYSMPRHLFLKLGFGKTVPKKTTYNCDYCGNKWGIDLCGCGSGMKFHKCDNHLPECMRTAQSIELGITKCTTDKGNKWQ